ncbi:MAG: hypothetical protein ACREJ8_06745, partial [Candidatus Methylomirabilales bacterium]
MVRRRKRLKNRFSRESAPEEVQPQASAEAPPGVEAESAHPVLLDEVRTEPPAEAPEVGVEAPLIAEASDEGEPQSAAHEPEGVEVQLPPEAPEETIVQFVAQAPREIEAQAAAEASPEIETLTPEQEAELRDQESATRRQFARFFVGGKAKGRVTAIYDAVVLNLSIGGSLIEHAHVVRPGTL